MRFSLGGFVSLSVEEESCADRPLSLLRVCGCKRIPCVNADPSSTSGRVRACQSDPSKRARGEKTVPVSGRARANLDWPARVSCGRPGRGREKMCKNSTIEIAYFTTVGYLSMFWVYLFI